MEWGDLSVADKEAARLIAWQSLLGFTRVIYRFVWGNKFSVNWHHEEIFRVCEEVYAGKSNRDILNVAPGGTKTDTVAIHFPAWAIFREYERSRQLRKASATELKPSGTKSSLHTRWLSLAYSDDLVTKNSGKVLDIIKSDPFQYFCPNHIDPKRGAQGDWKMWDNEGGGHEMYAVSLLGQVTGNRAGFLRPGFSGALVVDDPMPPRDERSFAKKDVINKNLNRVVRNRLMHPAVPIVMIQQRIATGDQTDFLRGPKSLDDYRLTKFPALITPKIAKAMPLKLRARMVEATGYSGVPVSYWESQVDTEYLMRVQANDPFLFTSQYQQAPNEAMLEGAIFKVEMAKLILENRHVRIKKEPHVPVDTYWDLGINDDMAITLCQSVGRERRIIGAYHNRDVGLEHYLQWLEDYAKKFNIRYGRHWGPHDLKNRGKFTAKSDKQVAQEAGLKFEPPVDRPQFKRDAINATRKIFDYLLIDEEATKLDLVDPNPKQEDRWLWAALQRYHRIWDAENEVFLNEPAHDWASNPVDSFMLIGLTYKAPELEVQGPAVKQPTSFWSR